MPNNCSTVSYSLCAVGAYYSLRFTRRCWGVKCVCFEGVFPYTRSEQSRLPSVQFSGRDPLSDYFLKEEQR
jgi:hypothetical protein